MSKQVTNKADSVRTFLAKYSSELERQGFYIRSAHFMCNSDSGQLNGIRISYTEKGGCDDDK